MLLISFVMKKSLLSRAEIIREANRYQTELATETDRFVPRDLIRLCQFIEVWIPEKNK